jgi:hypothetical protein
MHQPLIVAINKVDQLPHYRSRSKSQHQHQHQNQYCDVRNPVTVTLPPVHARARAPAQEQGHKQESGQGQRQSQTLGLTEPKELLTTAAISSETGTDTGTDAGTGACAGAGAGAGTFESVASYWRARFPRAWILGLSAKEGVGTAQLVQQILRHIPHGGPKYFSEDECTDRNERFFAAEIIRECILSTFDVS